MSQYRRGLGGLIALAGVLAPDVEDVVLVHVYDSPLGVPARTGHTLPSEAPHLPLLIISL